MQRVSLDKLLKNGVDTLKNKGRCSTQTVEVV